MNRASAKSIHKVDIPFQTGLVCEIQKTSITIFDTANQPVPCDADHAAFPRGAAEFAIGDAVSWQPFADGRGVIRARHPRRCVLTRPRADGARRGLSEEHVLAANVDRVIISASAAQPAFKPRFIDRYQILCQRSQIPFIICINKVDLVTTLPDVSMYQSLGIPVVFVSARDHSGLEELRSLLKGQTAVFTGHSGVGKSSLVNALLGAATLRTGQVQQQTGKGKHTTVFSTLQPIPGGGYIIDTPGIRTLGLGKMSIDELLLYFPEFAEHPCRFRNCRHQKEPGCAVQAAVSGGLISAARYDSYSRLLAEI